MIDALWDDRSHRANSDARITIDTSLRQGILAKRTDEGTKTALDKCQEREAVSIPACGDTFSAQHAPIGIVVQKRMARIYLERFQQGFEGLGIQAHVQKAGDLLKLAASIRRTVAAVYVVCGQKQSQRRPLEAPHSLGVGPNA